MCPEVLQRVESENIVSYRKKLIEVALPLEAINKEAAREKSIRHGHPSTLHLWWARRPLAACRAVLFTSLVDDPSSDPAYRRADGSVDEDAAGIKRAQLFDLIEELVKWENSNNTRIINKARAEIARCVMSRKIELGELAKDTVVFGESEGKKSPKGPISCSKGGPVTAWDVLLMQAKPDAVNHVLATYAPPVLDPFAGGGSIPLEAQRLGLRAYASDLNPVAVLINKALIEIPPKFADQPPVHPDAEKRTGWSGAQGLAEDVRCYGKWMRDEAEKRIGHLYPKVKITQAMVDADRLDLEPYVGQELTVIAWLWARTVASPNPAMDGAAVPLIRSFWLSKKKGKEAYVEPIVDKRNGAYRFEVRAGKPHDGLDPDKGTVIRTGGTCLISGSPISFEHIRDEGKQGRIGQKLMAIVCERQHGRVYIDPIGDQEQLAIGIQAKDYPVSSLPEQALSFRVQLYGMDEHWKLFTPRQLTAMVTMGDLAREATEQVRAHHKNPESAEDYARAVSTYLAESTSKLTAFHCTLASWRPKEGKSARAFGRQNLPMNWDFAEVNPFAGAGGSLDELVDAASKTIQCLPASASATVTQANAVSASAEEPALVCTDPPYYDNVGYADLADFYYVWLRRCCKALYPALFATLLTPKDEELIATPFRHDGSRDAANAFFEAGLGRALGRIRETASADFPVTVFFAFKQAETDGSDGTVASTGWETFLTGIIRSGYLITGTWPARTESTVGLKSMENVLASSIVLVCRGRPDDASMATRREFADKLRAELPEAIRNMQLGNVAPVDLAQASIGPGMAAFSRYSKVVNADGTPMSVREALQLINQVLDEVLVEQESDFDADTRWALKWFDQYGQKDGPFGDAEVLATAMAVSVKGVEESGITRSGTGKVRLLNREEMDGDWDPQTDARLTIWEVTQHLIRALENEGETGAAALLRRVGAGAGETARELAYRLYQTCERKKWADEARSYNGLVVSWPEIERLARERRAEPAATQAELDFG